MTDTPILSEPPEPERTRPSEPEPEPGLSAAVRYAASVASRMRLDGATEAECLSVLEGALRASWPRGRAEPWHYLCETCDDTGWVTRLCSGSARCGAGKTAQWRIEHSEHFYVQPCGICPKGAGRLAAVHALSRRSGEGMDPAEAGTTKQRKFTRWGRKEGR